MGAKKILFPLEMRNGEKVHTLEELKEKFDVGRVLEYADSGQLVRWLRDRKADDMAEKIESLDNVSEEYAKGICEAILGEVNGEILRQIEEVKGRKENVEKEAEEKRRLDAEKEERKKQPPTLLVNSEGIYVVEGNRLILRKACKKYSRISRDFYPTYGVVQEGEKVYYLKNCSKNYLELFVFEINLETGEEQRLCKGEDVCLCGVRNHKLFYRKKIPYDAQYLEIIKMDLDTLQKESHKIKIKSMPVIGSFTLGDLPAHMNKDLHCKMDYPCIDENGKHMYCRMAAKKYSSEAYIADIDLEENKIITLASLDSGHDWYYQTINWGVGRYSFIVYDGYNYENGHTKEKCFYYDMTEKQLQQCDELGAEISKLQDRYCLKEIRLCCDGERIYWLVQIGEYGLALMEYNIVTGESIERVYLKNEWLGYAFENGAEEIFVSNGYLYMNNITYFQSWRFSLDDWKPEKLVKGDSEHKYVVAEINS